MKTKPIIKVDVYYSTLYSAFVWCASFSSAVIECDRTYKTRRRAALSAMRWFNRLEIPYKIVEN